MVASNKLTTVFVTPPIPAFSFSFLWSLSATHRTCNKLVPKEKRECATWLQNVCKASMFSQFIRGVSEMEYNDFNTCRTVNLFLVSSLNAIVAPVCFRTGCCQNTDHDDLPIKYNFWENEIPSNVLILFYRFLHGFPNYMLTLNIKLDLWSACPILLSLVLMSFHSSQGHKCFASFLACLYSFGNRRMIKHKRGKKTYHPPTNTPTIPSDPHLRPI